MAGGKPGEGVGTMQGVGARVWSAICEAGILRIAWLTDLLGGELLCRAVWAVSLGFRWLGGGELSGFMASVVG